MSLRKAAISSASVCAKFWLRALDVDIDRLAPANAADAVEHLADFASA
jgi:hypothetical protein